MMAAPRVSLGALKEPLGLSRGLQWFFSIFAFATCGGFEGSVTFTVTCAGGDNGTQVTNVTATYGYPFRLNQAVFQPSLTHLCNHTWPRDVHLVGDFSSAARFFVGVAVGAFLYSLGALGVYLGYLHLYRCAGSRLPLMVSVNYLYRTPGPAAVGAALGALALRLLCLAQGLGHVRGAATAPLPHCPAPGGDVTCARTAATPMGGWGVRGEKQWGN
ncbi:synaptophysin-like protein 1 [Melozone crissalis]|uniref:synaptophysin-like protein 1 n=1 Tax=Melozone crissalis TaxID=40204 RepID=UPI0023DA326C|nr:synaptophysin-like protein 1 [Melozone crissalis]